MNVNLSKPRELVMDREASHGVVHGVAKTWIWLSGWTELMPKLTGEKLFGMDKITEHYQNLLYLKVVLLLSSCLSSSYAILIWQWTTTHRNFRKLLKWICLSIIKENTSLLYVSLNVLNLYWNIIIFYMISNALVQYIPNDSKRKYMLSFYTSGRSLCWLSLITNFAIKFKRSRDIHNLWADQVWNIT